MPQPLPSALTRLTAAALCLGSLACDHETPVDGLFPPWGIAESPMAPLAVGATQRVRLARAAALPATPVHWLWSVADSSVVVIDSVTDGSLTAYVRAVAPGRTEVRAAESSIPAGATVPVQVR